MINRLTWGLALAGLVLRLFLIFPGPLESKVEFFYNRADLRNYYWPAQAALQGQNPYVLWTSGQSGVFRADMAPLELLVYLATVNVWNDSRAIQILFALFDVVNIVLLGMLLKNSPLKVPFQIFYALGPLTLYNLVLVPQDKTILLTLTFLIFILLLYPPEHVWKIGYLLLAPADAVMGAAGLLAAFKWLSVFYLLPLLLFVSPDVRAFFKRGIIFGTVVVLAHLPWFPDWMYVYTFRAGRVVLPSHISLGALLHAIGLYDRSLLLMALVASLLAIYALFWLKRIDIFETMAFSVMVGVLWTPDMDPVHLSIVVLYLLLVVNWSSVPRRMITWGLSAWVAAVYAFSTRAGYASRGLPDVRAITGVYGSTQMIVLSYVLFIAVLGLYLFDKLRRRAVGRDVLVSKVD